jgi:hypothetical protein
MKYSLPREKEKAKFYFDKLIDSECMIELKKINRPRTIRQNKYLHVLLNLYAIERGDTLKEIKKELKKECAFMHEIEGEFIILKSSADLDTKGLHDWIEWIKDNAGQQGIYLPSPEEYLRNWEQLEKEIENHKQYL